MKYLLDNNVLLYLIDRNEPIKSERADQVLHFLRTNYPHDVALPAQALAEFSNAARYRLKPALGVEVIRDQVGRFIRAYPVLPLTEPVVLEALRG